MGDNDLKTQVQQASAQALAIRNGLQNCIDANLRLPNQSNCGPAGMTNLRGPQFLNEEVNLLNRTSLKKK